MLTVSRLVSLLEELAPRALAQAGDPGGLQCGSPLWELERVMLALDADAATVRQAAEAGAGLLVTHHPLIYTPLHRVDPSSGTGEAVSLSLTRRVAVYCAHTNLDVAPGGMNRQLAALLGLEGCRPLDDSAPVLCKLVVFVPTASAAAVEEALFRAGAGRVGRYSCVSFSVGGEGAFLPGEGARPAVGEVGRRERVEEVRLEVVVPEPLAAAAARAAREAHPYEVPVVDLYRLQGGGGETGMGLVGELAAPCSVSRLLQRLEEALPPGVRRLVGDAERQVRRVALCTGSGSSLMGRALAAGAELFITGDLRYHEARGAQEAGLALLDVGHFSPERYGMERLGRMLAERLEMEHPGTELLYAQESDPFRLP